MYFLIVFFCKLYFSMCVFVGNELLAAEQCVWTRLKMNHSSEGTGDFSFLDNKALTGRR